MGIGDGDWGLGIGDWAQSPIPNPQSPNINVTNLINFINEYYLLFIIYIINKKYNFYIIN